MMKKVLTAMSLANNFIFSKPFYASFDVTNYCNLRCEGCDFPFLLEQGTLGKDIPVEGIEARVEALNEAFGSLVVVLAGFEPTVRGDLTEIIETASQRNVVGVVTNGTLLTPDKAKQYWASGMAFASVSMPTTDEHRFRELTGVKRYGVADVKGAIEMLAETVPKTLSRRIAKALGIPAVAITATIDNLSTPAELYSLASYAESVGVGVSFQPYSASKPASAVSGYLFNEDKRAITVETLDNVFNGSIAKTIGHVRKAHPTVIGRQSALRNFDIFVREGQIPFKPRSVKRKSCHHQSIDVVAC